MIARSPSQDMIEKALAAEPIDPTDANDPIEPMDSTLPTEPIDRIELRLPMLSNELSERHDHFELELSTSAIAER